MTAKELLAELERRGVRLWVEGDRLRFDAPKGVFDDTLRDGVKACRDELMDLLADAAPGGDLALAPIPRDGRELPLSFGQQRLWFLDQLTPDDLAYNVPATVRLRGPLDAAAMGRGISEIVRRHETLRSRFPSVGGKAQLVIEPPAAVELEPESIEALPEDERIQEATRLAREDACRPFDLAGGPLFRVRLFRLGPEDHVMHVVMHHIISDGWSMGVFFRELAPLYGAFLRGDLSPLPDLPLQYADHAWWQQESLERHGLERDLSWWREQLGGDLPTLDLPRDRPRPSEPGHHGAFVWIPVETELRDALASLSQREGATRFQIMLAAFYVLLARHAGQDDLVVGTPIAARGRRQIEGLIGFFVNNLVLRGDLSGDPTFRELLVRVRGMVLDAFAHQDVPFEKLVEELKPERELGRNPLFQVLFNHFDLSEMHYELPPLEMSTLDMTLDVSKFDLTLHCFEIDGRLVAKIEYDTDLFDPETVQALGEHYVRLLQGIVADPGGRISRLPMLSDAERARLLVEWNRGAFQPLEAGSIHELFEAQARRTPDAPALVCEDQELSFAELQARVSDLARRLVAKGVGPEVKVALFLDRSAEMIVALLGVLEAGGAYVPLDVSTPGERLGFVLDDADCKLLLTRTSLRSELPDHPVEGLCVDEDETVPDVKLPAARPGQLAYVIYTSGSTGTPKGVEVEHAQVLHYLAGVVPRLDVPADSSYATVSTLAADLGNTCIFPSLCFGGCLHVLSDERIGDGDAFADWFARHHVDVLKIVPSHLEALLSAAAHPQDVLPATLLVLGGEACSWELVERVQALAPGLEVLNHYGPAETTVGVLTHRIAPGDRQRFPSGPPVGRPLAGTQVYLVDKHGEPVPVGAAGEVLVAGGSVTRGYRNRPELTAERFVSNPFRRGSEGRAYRTGDLARYTRDGELLFLGRADDQVKVRGFRVEPGEVQTVLERHADVSAAAVVVQKDPLGVARLVAYVVPRAGASPEAAELRSFLRAGLPDYMVPSSLVTLDALPLNKNGKLDRRALPAADFDRDVLREDYVAPRTPAEETLAAIWCDVLRLDRVGVHDNFFELGGESILSIQIISRANQVGLRLKPKDVFERPTVAELAAAAGSADESVAEQGPVTGPVPLTPIQHRFFEQDLAEPWHYNHAMLLKPARPLSAAVLEPALAELERHHDVLRLRFARGEAGAWTQTLIAPTDAAPFEQVDLGGLPADERKDALQARARQVQGSLDLTQGPLWRAVLFTAADAAGDDRLLLVVHHLAVDGVSWRLLLEDLSLACEQIEAGRPVALPAKTSSFQDWAEALVERAGDEALRAGAAAWTGPPVPPLPVDHEAAGTDNVARRAETLAVSLDEAETEALLREVPRAYRTRINDVLLAALLRAAEPWTGSSRLLVDLESHGREDALLGLDTSRTVGWFTSLSPVVLDSEDAAGPGEVLRSVKEQLRAVRDRGALDWGLLRWLSPAGEAVDGLRARPGAQIGFNYMGRFDQSLESGGLFRRAPESPGVGTSLENGRHYLLDVGGSVTAGKLSMTFTWATAAHDRTTVQALAERFAAALREFIAHCTTPGVGGCTPSDFPLARLDQPGLTALEARYGADNIEDIYALSPLQRGMIFHALAEPGSATYVTQLALTFHGELSADRFRAAWQRALDSNPVLRTGFVVDDRGEMNQVVCRKLPLRWHDEDWSGLSAEELQLRLASQARSDRETGFDLADPPLMRLRLIRLGPDRHRFLWTHHHALLDGWSLPLLIRDVFAAYGADGPVAVGEARRPFSEYIRWLADQDEDAAREHWRALLSDWSEPTPLPAGQTAPGGRAVQGHRLTESTTAALTALARRRHVTLNTLVQGAWALLLARHAGRDEVLFGVTISGRPPDLPGVETMLGLFINTLPLRVDATDDELGPWLRRLQQQLVELQQYEASPLYEVQTLADTGGANLFDSIVVFENYPIEVREPVASSGLRIEDAVDVSHATFPLALVAQPGPRQLNLELRYDAGRYDAPTIHRLLGHLGHLLEGMAAERATRLSDLPLLSDEERELQLETWNDTSRPYPRDVTVPALFEEQARATPRAPALSAGGQDLTYAELDRRANRLAHHLRGRGVQPGALVAIQTGRGADLVTGFLAILKAGAAYLPLDPDHPPRRVDAMLADSGATALVTTSALAAEREGFAGTVVALDADGDAIAAASDEILPATGTATDLAYVIYTSGSTGQPKGTCIPHRGIVRLVRNTDYVDLRREDRIAQASNASFDAATFEIWGALLNGACLVSIDKDTALSPEALASMLREERVSVLFVTTALFNQLVQSVPDIFGTLRYLLFGGEAVDPRWVREVLHRGPPEHLLHVYGPTECTTYSTWYEVRDVPEDATTVPIGGPLGHSTAYVLDADRRPTPVGAPGELYLGGDGLALGYHRRESLTSERFVEHPFQPGERLYRTGDLVRQRPDGALEFVGRVDHQVKLRGFRIELGEIEEALRRHADVAEVIVLCREDTPGDKQLVAYAVAAGESEPARDGLRALLSAELPEYMIPSAFMFLPALPLNKNGKVDRDALPAPEGRQTDRVFAAPKGETEQRIAAIWRDVLGVDQVGTRDNFFDLGGHSLKLLAVHRRLVEELGSTLSVTDLFQHTTVEALAARLEGVAPSAPLTGTGTGTDVAPAPRPRAPDGDQAVAVIGMAGRFPGAPDVDAFWRNLCDGVESISVFSDEELREAGIPEELIAHPQYVKARAVIEDADLFDATFFGYTPREAELMDPQHRVFLECAWEVMERAGHDPGREPGLVGVFAGGSMNSYINNLRSQPEVLARAGGMGALISSINDFLPTRVSYKLNLRGPSVNVQTACSTSLVAVHEACRSLVEGRCDMAMAGGVAVTVPWTSGYVYEESGVRSSDGHCRAFDAKAEGMVSGNGVATVLLKRLADAVEDGDEIHAVIRGTAINNDGSRKIGFTAPSIDGQAEVIALAQATAGIEPDTVGYVECHGTGTALGDPIEVAALSQVFRRQTDANGFCALASLKSNMGHLDAAAGVAGLIKAALAVEHGRIPPSLHYTAPNPEIDFERSPFFVNTTDAAWAPPEGAPRRAGVSSFGIGGTNAHVVLEQPPALPASGPSREWQLLQLSARSSAALDVMTANLADHLEAHPDADLADVAWTLRVGRAPFAHRRAVLCRDVPGALEALRGGQPERRWSRRAPDADRPVVFVFPGQGAQYVNMGRGLYDDEPVFRDAMDACFAILRDEESLDLAAVLYPEGEPAPDATERLTATSMAQPALFAIEYALACLWRSWGVEPVATVGHSIGEYVSACLAGVLDLPAALRLVTLRGRLMEACPEGVMLAVPLPEADVVTRLESRTGLWLCGVNGPSLCVVGGAADDVDAFASELAAAGIEATRLHTSHAFHSGLMEGAVQPFVDAASELSMAAPELPYVSTLTGDWATADDVADPSFWGRQIREPVRYSEAIRKVLEDPDRVILEVGPGQTLSSLTRLHDECGPGRLVLSSIRHPRSTDADPAFLMGALARLWTGGVDFDAARFHAGERRRRVTLPTYPFERQRYWIERKATAPAGTARRPLGDWFYEPVWRPTRIPDARSASNGCSLVFSDGGDVSRSTVAGLQAAGRHVVVVGEGAAFGKRDDGYTLDPASDADLGRMLGDLRDAGTTPDEIVHLWCLTDGADGEALLDHGFLFLHRLVRALGEADVSAPLRLTAVTGNVHLVRGDEVVVPEQAAVAGVCRVAGLEQPNLTCRHVDIGGSADAEALLAELLGEAEDAVVALRDGRRRVESFVPVPLPAREGAPCTLGQGGAWLVTGGLGGMGLALAAELHRSLDAKLVLVGRTELRPRDTWEQHLAAHPADDPVSRRIAGVQALEAAGAEVMLASGDVADAAAMAAVVKDARARFGAIAGVVHAAGVPPSGLILTRDAASARAVMAPKVQGTRVLLELLGDEPDVVVLCSSLNVVKGFPGTSDYAAANGVLEAFARSRAGAPGPEVISIAWNRWRESGMAVDAAGGPLAADQGITDAEGAEVLRRVLDHRPGPGVLVSERDLRDVLAPESAPSPEQDGPSGTGAAAAAESSLHPRPELATEFVAPSNDTEQQVAELWQELFGIGPLGVHDDFLELGGHSLLATQLLNRLVKLHPSAGLTLRAIFDNPTVAGLARRVDEAPGEGDAAPDESAPAMTPREDDVPETGDLDALSDEEVTALLKKLSSEDRRDG